MLPPKGGFKKKTAPSDGTATPYTPSLAEQLSYLHLPKPFKNPNYTKNVNRRVKNLKTILGQEREREKNERERRRQEKLEAEAQGQDKMDVDGESEQPKVQVQEQDEEIPRLRRLLPCYLSDGIAILQASRRASFLDGPGYLFTLSLLQAPYTHPATGLRYHDKSVYEVVKGLSASTAKEYLSARGVNSIVK
ncbi:hypothetical protein NP233_g177 [Leucocoprinus birnbaumii]|uniref:Vps72/YL1 C-terminal domain-containing protein n=1 Tax=Leucocoprinus birnbaumii TaxID=56174 RepID=A0AAD5Z0H5_9AGAR|nr:hypothetical protein NP233_g177 [Leucocoprinus birnbaumii]